MPSSISGSNSSALSGSEEGWTDVDRQEDDGSSRAVVSLLDDRLFPDATAMLSYCKERYHFDFLDVRNHLGLEFYGAVRLINFIRQRVLDGVPLPEEIVAADFEDESYLQPVLEDDALIIALDDLPGRTAGNTEIPGPLEHEDSPAQPGSADRFLERRNAELQEQLESMSRRFESYRLAVQQTLDNRWDSDDTGAEGINQGTASAANDSTTRGDDSEHYFASYADREIHETMLKDVVRTGAYRDFIYGHKELFAGKIVLDIGCGTGILSMFCAKAGAKLVIAVDRSAIIDKARENIYHNGLGNKITCLRGMIENVTLPVGQVDIIVSEWMGYCLLYEAMLPSVLWARDRYLKPDGLLVPSHATLSIAPVAAPGYISDHVAFWKDVYSFDMTAMQEGLFDDVRIESLCMSDVCGSACVFRLLDLYSVRQEDLAFKARWHTELSSDIDALDGFVVWFDIYFATARSTEATSTDATAEPWMEGGPGHIAFTTGPAGEQTHWKQTLLLKRPRSHSAQWRKGHEVSGEISFSSPEDNHRALSLGMEWGEVSGEQETQSWKLR